LNAAKDVGRPASFARGAGTPGRNGLYSARGVARLPVALEQKSRLTPFEMRTQFVRQRWQNRRVAKLVADELSFSVSVHR